MLETQEVTGHHHVGAAMHHDIILHNLIAKEEDAQLAQAAPCHMKIGEFGRPSAALQHDAFSLHMTQEMKPTKPEGNGEH